MKGSPPTSDRGTFVLTALRRAENGRPVEARDAIMALLTALDVKTLASRIGEPEDVLIDERLAARRRLLAALGGD